MKPPTCLDASHYDATWRYELMPLTFGRMRIIWTDSFSVDAFW